VRSMRPAGKFSISYLPPRRSNMSIRFAREQLLTVPCKMSMRFRCCIAEHAAHLFVFMMLFFAHTLSKNSATASSVIKPLI
jgi:hypothetical protein